MAFDSGQFGWFRVAETALGGCAFGAVRREAK